MSVAAMCMTLAALVSAAASERLPIAIVSERAEVIASVRAAAAIAHLPAVVVASADLATVLEPSRFSWLALADAPALPADAALAAMGDDAFDAFLDKWVVEAESATFVTA